MELIIAIAFVATLIGLLNLITPDKYNGPFGDDYGDEKKVQGRVV